MFTKINDSENDIWVESLKVRIGAYAKVINCEVRGNIVVGANSCFNRCKIDRYSGVGCFSYLADSEIGSYCSFGSRVSVGAFNHPTNWLSIHEFQYRDTGNIYGETILENGVNELLGSGEWITKIGSDVWIGDNAALARGISVGHGAIIGMSAVVTGDVPPYSIMVGNPARVLRKRFTDEVIKDLLDLRWWNMEMNKLKGIQFNDIHKAVIELRKRAVL